MKVKVGDTIYDGEEEPVMVILTEQDKKNIANMHDDAMRYCSYPEEAFNDHDDARQWMTNTPMDE